METIEFKQTEVEQAEAPTSLFQVFADVAGLQQPDDGLSVMLGGIARKNAKETAKDLVEQCK